MSFVPQYPRQPAHPGHYPMDEDPRDFGMQAPNPMGAGMIGTVRALLAKMRLQQMGQQAQPQAVQPVAQPNAMMPAGYIPALASKVAQSPLGGYVSPKIPKTPGAIY